MRSTDFYVLPVTTVLRNLLYSNGNKDTLDELGLFKFVQDLTDDWFLPHEQLVKSLINIQGNLLLFDTFYLCKIWGNWIVKTIFLGCALISKAVTALVN